MRTTLFALALGLVGLAAPAALEAAPAPRPNPGPRSPEPRPPDVRPSEQLQIQKEADRHFKSGVALYKDAKYDEALAEFERAYEIAPHPLVLYNIAGCHRELLHYAEAVTYYRRFLADGSGKVPAARLATAQTELDALLTLIGRVTVTITPSDGATLWVDGTPHDRSEMPLILAPGDHRLIARATGRRDAERTVKLAAGDQLAIELPLDELPLAPPGKVATVEQVTSSRLPTPPALALPARRGLAFDAGFGMNLRRLGNTGAPSIGVGAELGSRFGVGLDVVLVAYAVVPSVRVRVAGDALSLHVVGALPVAFSDDPMLGRFLAAAGGVGLRYRAAPGIAVRLESLVSVANKGQGTTLPMFLGGELWF
ncbi:MAG TPA: hypothetical protein VHN14_01545 [Kofleriaceae bacterium]|nr:hypothetical protein [Kofleriaceae bacterium]